jgi:hypothetical protein
MGREIGQVIPAAREDEIIVLILRRFGTLILTPNYLPMVFLIYHKTATSQTRHHYSGTHITLCRLRPQQSIGRASTLHRLQIRHNFCWALFRDK